MKHRPNSRGLLVGSVLLALFAPFVPATGDTQAGVEWKTDFQSRLEVYALMQTVNVAILGSGSATRSLEKWCRDRKLAETPTIVAIQIPDADRPLMPEQMQRLDLGQPEQAKHRKVRLYCGDRLLTEADNWYVPGRLTAEMNRLLETTKTPFGKVVAPLEPYRQTFSVKMLWSPLPEGWESGKSTKGSNNRKQRLDIPENIFEHRALVYGKDRKPIAEVWEVYRRDLLSFSRSE